MVISPFHNSWWTTTTTTTTNPSLYIIRCHLLIDICICRISWVLVHTNLFFLKVACSYINFLLHIQNFQEIQEIHKSDPCFRKWSITEIWQGADCGPSFQPSMFRKMLRSSFRYLPNFTCVDAGLTYIEETNPQSSPDYPYCESTDAAAPCAPGKAYYGRGPLQLSW
jgi:hypothetical protein